MDRAEPETGKGFRGHYRLRTRLSLRRLRHAPRTPDRTGFMTFETDSEADGHDRCNCGAACERNNWIDLTVHSLRTTKYLESANKEREPIKFEQAPFLAVLGLRSAPSLAYRIQL